MRYADEWREIIERLGRWIDFDNDYKVCITLCCFIFTLLRHSFSLRCCC